MPGSGFRPPLEFLGGQEESFNAEDAENAEVRRVGERSFSDLRDCPRSLRRALKGFWRFV